MSLLNFILYLRCKMHIHTHKHRIRRVVVGLNKYIWHVLNSGEQYILCWCKSEQKFHAVRGLGKQRCKYKNRNASVALLHMLKKIWN